MTSYDFTPDQIRRLRVIFERDYHRYVQIKRRMDAAGLGIGDPFRAQCESARESIYRIWCYLTELERTKQG